MNKYNASKKAARLDWHRADIVAALRKSGWSLRRLSSHHGYLSANTLSVAMMRPWPKGERLIADAIGVAPAEIWPSRYHSDGSPGRRRRSRDSRYYQTGFERFRKNSAT